MQLEVIRGERIELVSNGQTFTPFPNWTSADGNVRFYFHAERYGSTSLTAEVKSVKINRHTVQVTLLLAHRDDYLWTRDISAVRNVGTAERAPHGTSDSFIRQAGEYVAPYIASFIDQVPEWTKYIENPDLLREYNRAQGVLEYLERDYLRAKAKLDRAIDELAAAVKGS